MDYWDDSAYGVQGWWLRHQISVVALSRWKKQFMIYLEIPTNHNSQPQRGKKSWPPGLVVFPQSVFPDWGKDQFLSASATLREKIIKQSRKT